MKKVAMRDFDNKGFSLIELIVSILIMSVMTGMIIMLISASRATYNEVNTEAVIQGETEAIRNFVGELALEARLFHYEQLSNNDQCVWLYAPDYDESGATTNYCFYFLLREHDTNIVRYGKFPEKIDDGHGAMIQNPDLVVGGNFIISTYEICDSYDYLALLETADADTCIYKDKYALLAEHVSNMECSGSNGLITVTLKLNYNEAQSDKTLVFAGRNLKK